MRRTTRRMIERMEPFGEPPKRASSASAARADDGKAGGRRESPTRPRRPATKSRAK